MRKLLLQACLLMTTGALHAQVGIGIATPDASAQLHISATNKGLLIPRMTEANRPASPATGLMIYQTNNTPGYYYFDGSAWKMVGGGNWSLSGNSGTTAAHFIGTTDNVPLNFKVNNVAAGRIDNNYSCTSFGYEAGKNMSTGSFNAAFGHQALSVSSTSTFNTAIGFAALQSNNTGGSNTAVGSRTMEMNSSGFNNTAVGCNSLQSNTSGARNTGIGLTSMISNTDGNNNTALGYASLATSQHAHNNTAIGYEALNRNISGNNNTAVGLDASYYSTTGAQNTAVGAYAGVAFGFGAFSNTTAIGYNAIPTADNMVRIGDDNVSVIGGIVGWSALSDIRFKKDIAPQLHGLDFIMQLQPITYHLDADKLGSNQQLQPILYSGFSAQQVEEAAQNIGYNFSGVHKPQNDQDHYSLDYASFVVPLVKAVQEQQEMIITLRKQNQLLQEQINILKQAPKQ